MYNQNYQTNQNGGFFRRLLSNPPTSQQYQSPQVSSAANPQSGYDSLISTDPMSTNYNNPNNKQQFTYQQTQQQQSQIFYQYDDKTQSNSHPLLLD